ncbi:MAG: lactate dehydrogenase [Candidatus Thiodiazotropha taylori]|nr:lactate dehydrogenase [Candidatus Thiodiazotropha taylori]MCW4222867.1 lactate dehydrogenase [Candidatus Thiodiazotropha endolucinida]MCG7883444.1 lactate dehydrogenase [Candidatus Thiodiazotropha taylori]MCG7884448.1 lactate dehydrogenase [Candidatus Thiodiazotropha taylori]MCG7892038.1 lactate dehydrogenase [Candidatus Thiodiazotropha taylori]
MNAVEIEEAITQLAEQEFDPATFPFAFLEAFGNPATTIKRLKSGSTNKSDVEGGVLQRNNIHIASCETGTVPDTLTKLKDSPATTKAKAKFVVATDGVDFEAEDLTSDDPPVVCSYQDFPDHFGFFLPLAGISTVKQIRESSFDIKATGRLNRLYVQLIQDNPEWGSAERRHDMNHFMARLIFCFFAEDTDIFNGDGLFTETIGKMSARDSSNTHEVMSEIFRAMDTKFEDREVENLPRWANGFPYVNGGLFSGTTDVPRFSKIARSYLIHIGNLDWTKINPDIFGSMIQAVTDEEERGALGLHYTSVPNILKVLNPLFLDDLRAKLEDAGDNSRKLLNLRNRMAKIRVFDPACGSGNFLVISYKEMRAIEAEINQRRGEAERRTDIPLTNFRGIELRDFPAEIARLALIIAEYQCDVLYRGQQEALDEFLPLDAMNWIICGNALRLDWLSVCPPMGTGVKLRSDDLFEKPLEQAEIDFENEGGETYICGNPPFTGAREQSKDQKSDLRHAMKQFTGVNSLDYVCAWIWKAVQYGEVVSSSSAFVATSSLCQGQSISLFWEKTLQKGKIFFAYRPFKWQNNAQNNAAVYCVIVGITESRKVGLCIYDGETVSSVKNISPYLTNNENVFIRKVNKPIDGRPELVSGNQAIDGGYLILEKEDADQLVRKHPEAKRFLRPLYGANDFVKSTPRYCIWVKGDEVESAQLMPEISDRFDKVKEYRINGGEVARSLVDIPYRFRYVHEAKEKMIVVPRTTTERRDYLPIGVLLAPAIVTDAIQVLYDAEWFVIAVLSTKLHMVWIKAVAGRLKADPRYSNTLVYNNFPIPKLTKKNIEDLTRSAEDILLAREAHFPATISDLYDPDKMPENLRVAHERNDEVLERIYIGRRFKNDTERLEKLFDLYMKMTSGADSTEKKDKEES